MGNIKAKYEIRAKYDKNYLDNIKIIQRAYRKHIKRLEYREQQAIDVLQKLQYANENESAQTLVFFNVLIDKLNREFVRAIPREPILMRHARLSSNILMLNELFNDEYFNNKVTPINFPLTDMEFIKILDCICRKTDNVLPPQSVYHVLRMAAQNLRKLDNVNLITLPKKTHITICGPINGNLRDLIMIFYKNGMPSKYNPYVFNGDLVDNGTNGVEVLILLLACYLSYPQAIYFNRGNHEDAIMNSRYGFADELQRKYGNFSLKLLNLIDEIWRNLPLATILNERIFIVHGGISSATNLGFIHALDRTKYTSILRPANDVIDREEWEQIVDIVWSNDHNESGTNIERSAGCYFTQQDTIEFLRKHNFTNIISSNTVVPRGYEYRHNKKLLIISSGTNSFPNNIQKSAFVIINYQLKMNIVESNAKKNKSSDDHLQKRVEILERAAVEELKLHLYAKYDELKSAFYNVGPQATGFIRVSEWMKALENVTKLNIQWHMFFNELNTIKKYKSTNVQLTDTVPYNSTLEVINSESVRYNFSERIPLVDAIYKNTRTLEAIFILIDNERIGCISIDDFRLTCDILEQYIPGVNKKNLLRIYNLMDVNKKGCLGLSEFFQIFALCEKYTNSDENITIDMPNL